MQPTNLEEGLLTKISPEGPSRSPCIREASALLLVFLADVSMGLFSAWHRDELGWSAYVHRGFGDSLLDLALASCARLLLGGLGLALYAWAGPSFLDSIALRGEHKKEKEVTQPSRSAMNTGGSPHSEHLLEQTRNPLVGEEPIGGGNDGDARSQISEADAAKAAALMAGVTGNLMLVWCCLGAQVTRPGNGLCACSNVDRVHECARAGGGKTKSS